MSARQPFVPGSGFGSSSRPDSRAAQSSNGATSTPLHFVADPSNPLNSGLVTSNSQKDRSEKAENRPLNIGSLTKSNRSQNPPPRRQSMQTPSRPPTLISDTKSISAPNHIMRPGTSDPHSKPKTNPTPNHRLQAHANSHSIVAPTPLQARSTPSLFSNNASSSFPATFKTPALPGSRLSPPQHPSTDALDFRAPANDQMTEQQQQSPEQSQEEIVAEKSTFRLKTLPSQPGPHRLVFGARAASEDDEVYEIPEPEVAAVRHGSGRNKRGRSEVDEDDEEEHTRMHIQGYGGQAKRFKGPQTDENAYPHSSNDGNEMYHRSSSPHDVQEYPPQQPRRHSTTRSRSGNDPAPAVHRFPPQYPNPAQAPENSGSHSEVDRLTHLLKADDFDLAVDARIEKYTRLSEKWKTCTREEWMAGADELTALYNKIFDFAKSHMAAKVQLFADCDEKLKKQGEVLKERDGLLADVRDRLVADSGNVLGK